MNRPAPDDRQITAWALEAAAGDRAAASAVVRATQRDVWSLIAHLTDVQRADDLTQETYLRALAALPRFAGRSSVRTWLFAIARHTVLDHVRTRYRRPRTADADWAEAADREQAERYDNRAGFEEIVELNHLLAGLDPKRREALVLTQVLGLDYAEAAQVCGCPIGTIRSRVARARADLLEAMDEGRSHTG